MGDYHIRMQVDIDADPTRVRDLVATQDGIRSWWNASATLDRATHQLEVPFADQPEPFRFDVREGEGRIDWVTGASPAWWAGTTVRWIIGANPDAGGTRLLFEHRDYDPENPVIAIVTPAWAQIVLSLKEVAEGGAARPFFAPVAELA